MGKAYDAKRLINTIVINEEKTNELYQSLAHQMKDAKAKALFEKLAKDEARHKMIYSKLLENLPNDGMVNLSEEEALYTDTLIEANVFTNDKVRKRFAKEDALILAEKVERDGIMFIDQLRSIYPDLAVDELAVIMSEEKKHLKFVLDKQYTATIGLLGL
jgi:rubrerythrin